MLIHVIKYFAISSIIKCHVIKSNFFTSFNVGKTIKRWWFHKKIRKLLSLIGAMIVNIGAIHHKKSEKHFNTYSHISLSDFLWIKTISISWNYLYDLFKKLDNFKNQINIYYLNNKSINIKKLRWCKYGEYSSKYKII